MCQVQTEAVATLSVVLLLVIQKLETFKAWVNRNMEKLWYIYIIQYNRY